jgi:hypothetical protein
MIDETEEVATTMAQIYDMVIKENIGPDGFAIDSKASDWLSLEARDCRSQVERCRAWIRGQDRTKTIRPGVGADDYTRSVERYYNHHISKGAFLVASYLEGVRVKRRGSDGNFNIRINRHRNVL